MKRVIQFNTISATKALIRKLNGQGIKLTRKAADEEGKLLGSAYYRHDATINVSKGMGELGGRRNVLWHEAGHAEGNAAGSMKEIDKMHSQLPADAVYADPRHYKGAYKKAIQNEERLADTNAGSAMQKAGVPQANINQYHQDRIASRSTYGIKDNPSPVGNPSNPPGNPGSPIGTSAPASPTQQVQPAIPREPIKRSFGGAGLAIGGAGLLAAGGFAAASQKRPKDEERGFSSKAKLIQFMKNPLHREGIKPGTHRLGGVGVERKVRIRDIVSSQALVDEKKVRKLARFTKNMPGKATVSWNGKNWIAKDGNHRLNAMLKQGKRKATVLVQKLSSQQPVIQLGSRWRQIENIPKVLRRIETERAWRSIPTGKVLKQGAVPEGFAHADFGGDPVGAIKQTVSNVLHGRPDGGVPMYDNQLLKSFGKLPGARRTVFNNNNMGKISASPETGWRSDVKLPWQQPGQTAHFGNKHTVAAPYAEKFDTPYTFRDQGEYGNKFGFIQRSKMPAGTDWRKHTGDMGTSSSHVGARSDVPFGKQHLETEVNPGDTSIEKLWMAPQKMKGASMQNTPILDVTNTPRRVLTRAVDSYRQRLPSQALSSHLPLIQFNALGVGGVLPAWAKWTVAGIGGTSLAIEANRWRDPKHREKRKDVIAPASIGATIGAGLGAKAGFSKGLANTPVEALRSKLGPFPNMAKGAGKGLLKGIIPGAVVGAALTLPIRYIMKKDREMSSKEEIIQLGLAKRAAILGTAGAGVGVTGTLLRNPGREIRDDEDVSGKLLWRRSKVPLIRHYGVGVGNNQVAHVQATKVGGSALFKTESLDAFKANRPTYVQASRRVDQAKLREVKKSIRQHNVSAEGFSFLRNNCEIAANGALKLKRPTNQAHDAEIGAGVGAAAGVAAATIIPAVGRIIKKVRQFSASSPPIQFGGISIATTKKVLRDLRTASGTGKIIRKRDWVNGDHYDPLQNVVRIPRDRRAVSGVGENMLETALHETGHAADPKMRAIGNRIGRRDGKEMLSDELTANRNVLTSLKKHGSEGEVAHWREAATKQLKGGYRNELFRREVDSARYRRPDNRGKIRRVLDFIRDPFGAAVGSPSRATLSEKKQVLRNNPWLRKKETALSSRLRLIQLGIKAIPLSERRAILRSIRRNLEKTDPANKTAVRAALGHAGSRPVMADQSKRSISKIPRLVDIDGQKSLLHYRGAKSEQALKTPENPQRLGGSYNAELVMGRHARGEGRMAISTSTKREEAMSRIFGHEQGQRIEGVYATPLRDLVRNQREKSKGAILNNTFPSEQEITQMNGDNLIKIRKYSGGAIGGHGSDNMNIRRLSLRAKLIQFNDDLQPHQQRVIRRITNPKTRGLVVAHGVGSGKTRTSIEAHKALGGAADVVLPAALRGNYEKEIAKWGADSSKISIHSQQALATSKEPLKSNLLIVDEGHRARNPGTKIAQAISASPAMKRMILTGTPIYNNPADIATLVNQAAGKPVMREGKAFHNRYLKPGIFKRWSGGRLSHEGELKKHLNEYVDYHKGDPAFLPTVTAKTVPVEMTKHQSQLYRASMGRIPKGMKLDMENIERLKPYLTGPRQVSNTARALDRSSGDEPKIDKAFGDLRRHLDDPKGKALVYSNWIEHGINPMQQRLQKESIPHGVFTGNEPMKQRNQTVKDYNEGKHRALLVSSSGAEGLDLKGTRMVQVLEPHFNNAKIRQVVGRSARMNSHAHLPKEDRNVEVRQYVGRPRNRFFRGNSKGVEDMLNDSARDKDEIDKQITRLLSSKRKLIEFGGKFARKVLAGTPSVDDPTGEGQAIYDAVTRNAKAKDVGIESGPHPETGRLGAHHRQGAPEVKAQDWRDKTGYQQTRAKFSRDREAKKAANEAAKKASIREAIIKTRGQRAADEYDRQASAIKVKRDAKNSVGPAPGSLEELKATRKNIAAQARVGKQIAKQANIIAGGKGFGKIYDNPTLPATLRGVRTNLKKSILEPYTLSDGRKVTPRKGAVGPGMVEIERQNAKARSGQVYSGAYRKIKENLQSEGKESMRGNLKILRNTIHDSPLVATKAPGAKGQGMKDIHPDTIASRKAQLYGPLSHAMGISHDEVENIHKEYLDLRRGGSAEAHAIRIVRRPDRSAFADVPLQRRSNYGASTGSNTRPPKTLKKIAIGAGLIGAGMLAKKLLKKKDQPQEQLMSRQGRLIQFGIEKALRMGPSGKGVKPVVGGAYDAMLANNELVQRLLHKKSLKAGAFVAKPGKSPLIRQAFRNPLPVSEVRKKLIPGSKQDRALFHYPEGHPLHSHAGEHYSATAPGPVRHIEARQWTAKENGKVARAKAGDIGYYGVPDASVMRTPKARSITTSEERFDAMQKARKEGGPIRYPSSGHDASGFTVQDLITRAHALEKETIAGTHVINQRNAQETAKFLLTPPLKGLTSKDAARRYGRAKSAKETRDIRSAMDSERTAHTEAMNSQRSSYESKADEQKSKAKRRLLIGTSAGLTAGAGIGYITTRPPKEMEFGVKDLYHKIGTKYGVASIRTSDSIDRVGNEIANRYPLVGAFGRGMLRGLKKTSVAVGTAEGVREVAKEKLKERAKPHIGKVIGSKFIAPKQRPGQADGYFIPQKLHAKGDILRFDVSPIQKLRNKVEGEPKASVWSHAATGGIEGAAGIYAVEPLLERYMHGKGTIRGNFIKTLKDTPKGHAKKIAIGAAVGALTTAPIGWAVEKYRKRQMDNRPMLSSKQKLIHFATSSSPVAPGTRTRVAADRYVKQIHERDMDRTEHGYLRTSLGGAAIGALTAKRLGTTKGKAALIGGLAGIGTQALVRHSTAKTKDQFGDRPYTSKLIDRAPGQVAGIAALGLAGKAGYDKLQAAKIAAKGMARKVKIGALGAAGLYAASQLFSAKRSNDLVQFEGEDQQIPKGYKLVKEFKKSKPRSWTRKWLADDINIGRRTQDIRTATSRIGNVAKDIGGAIKGEAAVDARGRPRKREWDKPWAQALKWGALLGATAGGLKMVRHASKHGLGPVGEIGEFFRGGGASRVVKNQLSKFPKVEKFVNKTKKAVGDFTSNLKEEGNSVADRVNRGLRKAAGERIPPPYHTVKVNGLDTRVPKGHKLYDEEEMRIKSPANRSAADKAAQEAEGIEKENRDLRKPNNPNIFSSNLKPIYFQRLTKEEQRARIDDFRDTSGKEPRLYHNYNAVVEHNALHPSVVQRQPRGPNQETNETRAWRARRRMAYALIAGTALGASWKRPGLASVAKNSAPIMASSKDPLIELNNLLDSALL